MASLKTFIILVLFSLASISSNVNFLHQIGDQNDRGDENKQIYTPATGYSIYNPPFRTDASQSIKSSKTGVLAGILNGNTSHIDTSYRTLSGDKNSDITKHKFKINATTTGNGGSLKLQKSELQSRPFGTDTVTSKEGLKGDMDYMTQAKLIQHNEAKCKLQVSPKSVIEFTDRVLYDKANVLILNLNFSNDIKVTWSKGVILPLQWRWVYMETYSFLRMPHAAIIYSLGLLLIHKFDPLDIQLSVDSQSNYCGNMTLVIGETNSDTMIGKALGRMTNEIASKSYKYNSSHWCYIRTYHGRKDKLLREIENNFFGVYPELHYTCCRYRCTSDMVLKRRILCSDKHHYNTVWWDIPLYLGFLMLLYFPLIHLKFGGLIHEHLLKSTIKYNPVDSGSSPLHASLTNENRDGPTDDPYNYVFYWGKSPISLLSMIASCFSKLMPNGLAARYRVTIFLWPLLTLTIPSVEVALYYYYLYDYVQDLAENDISFGFSSVLAGWSASKNSKLGIFGGPFIALGIYVLIGWVLLLSPKIMANQLYKGICDSPGGNKSLLCLSLDRKESLGSIKVKRHYNGYTRLLSLQICHLYMVINPDFWIFTTQLIKRRLWSVISVVKQIISVKSAICVVLPVCLLFCLLVSFLEIVMAVAYFGIPLISFPILAVKGFTLGLNKYITRKVCSRCPIVGYVIRIPVCGMQILCQIYYLYIFTVLFVDSFIFLARICMFTYTAVVAYPRETYGYFMLVLISVYFTADSFYKFGNIYKKILKITIKLCKKDANLRDHLAKIQDLDNNVTYGIPKEMFEYLVVNVRPRRVQVLRTCIRFVSMVFVLSVSIVLMESFNRFEDISLLIHVCVTVFACAVPTLYESVAAKDNSKNKLTRKLKRCLREWLNSSNRTGSQ